MKAFLALALVGLAHRAATTESPTTTITNTKTSTIATPQAATWKPLGCYSPDAGQPILEERTPSDVFMSIGLCTSRCESLGNYAFAGLQNGTGCWCGNHLGGALSKNQSDCSIPCAGF